MGATWLSGWFSRHALLVIGGWLFLLIVLAPWAPKLGEVLQDHGLAVDGEHSKVQQLLEQAYGMPANPVIVLFEGQPSVAAPVMEAYLQRTMDWLRLHGDLDLLVSPLEQPGMREGNTAYALITFQAPTHRWGPKIDTVRAYLPEQPGITVRLTGQPVIQAEVNEASHRDFRQAELIGVPIAFLFLLLAFGGFAAAAIPIVCGLVTVSTAMGIMYWIGTEVVLSSFVLNVIPMVGLALSLDFALMLVSRYREELATADPTDALSLTMATAGRAVFFAAGAVALGLLGTLWIPLPMFRSVALASLVVLSLSFLIAWSLVPALLSLLTPALRTKSGHQRRAALWHGWSAALMKRPVLAAVGSGALLLLCCLPLMRIQLTIPDAASLPLSSEARQAHERLEARFGHPSQSTLYAVLSGTDNLPLAAKMEAATLLVKQMGSDPLVMEAAGLPPVAGGPAVVRLQLNGEPGSSGVDEWLRQWDAHEQLVSGKLILGGEAKYRQEVQQLIYDNLGKVALSIAISNLVMLLLAFRSVIIAVKTLLMNILSLGASFGLLAWIFRDGLLGVMPGPIAIMIPVFIFGLAFSISMDYAVFLVSRIYETYRSTGNNEAAVILGLARTGRVITCAAAIIIAVTLPFAWGEVAGVQQLGVGIALAIFIDATLIRFLLMPALMKLLGKWNWWAPGLRR
ncbi:MMPL family transporter [Paenibacillus daejeonensis]|uniref:MMPL family transporter n=1 Tax=Paenibacillus daejeonensis TaxID=135193 RepID=UPI00036DE766|nr:MMPL family transporter [Paenibacillus daejeonensis]